jgi:hypothetical protein
MSSNVVFWENTDKASAKYPGNETLLLSDAGEQ